MKILIDETGGFNSKKSMINNCFIITLVSIPSKDEEKMINFFEKNNIKAKGRSISKSNRKKFFEELNKLQDVKYFIFISENKTTNEKDVLQIFNEQKIIYENLDLNQFDINENYSYFKKLNLKDFFKLQLIYNSIDFFYISSFKDYEYLKDDSWLFDIIIDTQNKQKDLVKYMKFSLFHAKPKNINRPNSWKDNHSFIERYILNNGKEVINNELLFDNISCKTEQEELLLNVPDIIGNTFYKIFNDHKDKYLLLNYIKLLDKNRIYILKEKKTFFINSISNKGINEILQEIQNLLNS